LVDEPDEVMVGTGLQDLPAVPLPPAVGDGDQDDRRSQAAPLREAIL
jgi:hypothetical protein